MNHRTKNLYLPPRSTTGHQRASAAAGPALEPRVPSGSADNPSRDCRGVEWTCRPQGRRRKLETPLVFDRERPRLSGTVDGATWPSAPLLPKRKPASSLRPKASERSHIAAGLLRDSAAHALTFREPPNILV